MKDEGTDINPGPGNNPEQSPDSITVSIVRCERYDPEVVNQAVKRSVELLGANLGSVFRDKRVLIKPNLLSARPPAAAVTTHPEVVRALVQLTRSHGGNPEIGDSPALGDFKRVVRITGMEDISREEAVPLVEFRHPAVLPVPESFVFKHVKVAGHLLEHRPVIINAPKLKTHQMMVMTAAVKNMYGAVCSLEKAAWHFQAGRDHRWFSRLLVELCEALSPALTVVDAVTAMEGEGPGSGAPRPVGLILASTSAVALDTVCARIMGLDEADVPTVAMARDLGIPGSFFREITVTGEELQNVVVTDFRLPGGMASLGFSLPRVIRQLLLKLMMPRPRARHSGRCTGCGACVEVCPAGILRLQAWGPEIESGSCIGCFCCSEICPEKVFVSQGGRAAGFMKALSKLFPR